MIAVAPCSSRVLENPTAVATNAAYRADIDGLRGVAVLSVLLFHLGAPAFGGGYVGVDVFFVISGYLIGGIVLTELNSHTFSLGQYYERRIRRIFPALFFMLGLSFLVAAFLLIPRDMQTFGHSVLAVTTFVSNMYFWRETGGYFQTPAEQQVLLHTWSLAVEEQFYIVFPLLLMAVQRVGQSRFALCIGFVIGASLAVSIGWIGASPQAVFLRDRPGPGRRHRRYAASLSR
jgi:peptidoglycan/LPS O-acetylase OafA/YrhL